MFLARSIIIGICSVTAVWQAIVWLVAPPPYILPSPATAAVAGWVHSEELLHHTLVTATEVAVGGVISVVLGFGLAIALSLRQSVKGWLMPVLAASQALPVFAIAPMLVLWMGYGLASKVAMTVIILFFPVVTAFYDGFGRISGHRIAQAFLMVEGTKYAQLRVLRYVILPAALPALASGLRIVAALAPLGAVVGEWVGSSAGLGYFILHSSARNQVDQLFAAVSILTVCALTLYLITDSLMRALCNWNEE